MTRCASILSVVVPANNVTPNKIPQLRDQLVVRRLIRRVLRQVDVAKSTLRVDDERSMQLQDVADRFSDPSSKGCLESARPHGWASHLQDARARNAICLVRDPLRIGQTNKGQMASIAEGGSLLDRSHRDDGDVAAGVQELLIVVAHVDHVLATHRSAEVPHKQ